MYPIQQMLTSITGAGEALNLCRTSIYEMIKDGRLETIKLGRRRLVRISSIKALIGESEVA